MLSRQRTQAKPKAARWRRRQASSWVTNEPQGSHDETHKQARARAYNVLGGRVCLSWLGGPSGWLR